VSSKTPPLMSTAVLVSAQDRLRQVTPVALAFRLTAVTTALLSLLLF
jgi:hypothetical protein